MRTGTAPSVSSKADRLTRLDDLVLNHQFLRQMGINSLYTVIMAHYNIMTITTTLIGRYAHLSKKLVVEDQVVKSGQPIGLGGNTGRSTGAHLHFETLLMGKNINPSLMFDFERQDVTGDFYTYRKGVYQEIDKKSGKIVESAEKLYHKVRKGENLSIIARKRGVSVNTLYRLNKMNSRTVLQIGQRIRYR